MKPTFVIPWYGADVTGGAETEARKTVEGLQRLAGVEVEVLTTCVQDFHSDWSINARPEGLEWVDGIPVRRFPVRSRNTKAFDAVNRRLMHGLPLTSEEEAVYMREMIHSPAMYDFIRNNGEDRIFLFIPYMFGTTYTGSAIHPDHSVLIPCLHDEPYAYLSCYREMFRRVRGVAFLTQTEFNLARRLYEMKADAPALVRGGVDTVFTSNAERFVAKYGLKHFLLYVGRKEVGKNVQLLVDYFAQYKRQYGGDLQLVLVGKGSVEIPSDRHHDILDLGFLPEQDKLDAYAAALVLCQPSLNESFSIVMMEAWVAGTPTLVHASCAVTREHCLEANGGLFFADAEEFAETVELLQDIPSLRQALGVQGRQYVLRHFTREVVVANYLEAFKQWGFALDEMRRPPRPVSGALRPRITEAYQLLAGFRSGDAISQMATTLQETLRAWGFASEIFAQHVHPASRGQVCPLGEFNHRGRPGQLLIYHHSIHSEASEVFCRYPGKTVLIYHNITPAHFFAGYSDLHMALASLGRAQLSDLIKAADLCLGDSRYNCLELEQYGAMDCRVLPVLLDLEAIGRIQPDPGVLRRFGDGRPTILYVGRPVPNKRQDNVLWVFARYKQQFAPAARLVLVGGSDETSRYEEELRELVRDLGLCQSVTLTSLVDDTQLVAYYRVAHAFLSMSEHEGFGVPLLEAMYFDVPVVAYAATAVPYTLGQAGLLVEDHNFAAIAERLHRVTTDTAFRGQILASQRRRLKDFTPQKVKAMLRLYLDELLDGGDGGR
jgi:glycosyltransferase involved in cell wall biosynthesis